MLTKNPKNRISLEEIRKHEFFAEEDEQNYFCKYVEPPFLPEEKKMERFEYDVNLVGCENVDIYNQDNWHSVVDNTGNLIKSGSKIYVHRLI